MTIPALPAPPGPRVPRPASTPPANGTADADFEGTMRRALLAALGAAAAGSPADTPMAEEPTATAPQTETERTAETEATSPEPGPLPGLDVRDVYPTTALPARVIVEHPGSSRGPSFAPPTATDPRAHGFTRPEAPASSHADVVARPPAPRSVSEIRSGPPGNDTTRVVHAPVVNERPAIQLHETGMPSDDRDSEAPEPSRELQALDTPPRDTLRPGPIPLDQFPLGDTRHRESPGPTLSPLSRARPPHPEVAPGSPDRTTVGSPDRMTLGSLFPHSVSPGDGTPRQGGLDTSVLDGSLPATPSSTEPRELTVDRRPAQAPPLDGPSIPRSAPHRTASQPPAPELSLSTARAAIAAWWEGPGSPRDGRAPPPGPVQPGIEPAPMETSVPPLRPGMGTHSALGSDAIAGAPSPPRRAPVAEDQSLRENLPLVARDVVRDPTTGTGLPPAPVLSTAPEGVGSESVLPSASRATTTPAALAPQGTGGEQMALTLRQDDGTAVTIRVLVRGDRVEATIIDRGPPQAPVGSRETGALHLALERQGFRDIHVAVQHLVPVGMDPLPPVAESRRHTEFTQDRNQHARRQDDEGTHSQGRSHQRSPRERER